MAIEIVPEKDPSPLVKEGKVSQSSRRQMLWKEGQQFLTSLLSSLHILPPGRNCGLNLWDTSGLRDPLGEAVRVYQACVAETTMSRSKDDVDHEVKECLDFMVTLVELAVPVAEKKDTPRPPIPVKQVQEQEDDDDDDDDDIQIISVGKSTERRDRPTSTILVNSCRDTDLSSSTIDLTKKDEKEVKLTVAAPVSTILSVMGKKTCVVCDAPKIVYQAVKNGQINFICSDDCLNQYKKISVTPPCLNCHEPIQLGSFAFKPTFGLITGVVCSEVCLEKYDAIKGPKSVCKNAACGKRMEDIMYHWQTMDFCSPKCVNDILLRLGNKCAHCKNDTPFPAIGKYSVRFGEIVRQFCKLDCLVQYKKSIRSCAFCQTEVGPKTIPLLNQRPVERDFGEGVKIFCTTACLDDYQKAEIQKKVHKETSTTSDLKTGDICDICSCFVETEIPNASPDYLFLKEGTIEERLVTTNTATDALPSFRLTSFSQVFLCSPKCASAYRFKRNHSTLFCYYCFRLDWNIRTGVLLRFNRRSRIFCTKRCMNLFIMRIRKLKSCECCKCQKYQFDLIEEAEHLKENSQYYCSLLCLMTMSEAKQLALEYGSTLDHIKCAFCMKIQKGFIHVRRPAEGVSGVTEVVKSFCTFACLTSFKKQEAIEAEEKKRIEKEEAEQKAKLEEQRRQQLLQLRAAGPPMQPRAIPSTVPTSNVPSSQSHLTVTTTNGPIGRPATSTTVAIRPFQPVNILRDQLLTTNEQVNQHTAVVDQSGKKEFIIMREPPKKVQNVGVQITPARVTKAIMCKPHLVDVGVQTDPM